MTVSTTQAMLTMKSIRSTTRLRRSRSDQQRMKSANELTVMTADQSELFVDDDLEMSEGLRPRDDFEEPGAD